MLPHPWRTFRDLIDWTLEWSHLPSGVWGVTDFDTRTVTLRHGMNQAERRCTIAHEIQHILRGPAPVGLEEWEEELVDRNAARFLLPSVEAIGDALVWADWNQFVAAEELWVDELILAARLRYLHPSEKGYLRERFDT
jgi:hypothetical protein